VLRFDKFKPTIKNSKYGRIKKRVSLAGGDPPGTYVCPTRETGQSNNRYKQINIVILREYDNRVNGILMLKVCKLEHVSSCA